MIPMELSYAFFGSKKNTRTAARNILTPWWYWRKQVLSYWLRNRCWQRLKCHVEFLATSMASCGICCCSLQPLASREVRKIPRMMMRFLFFLILNTFFVDWPGWAFGNRYIICSFCCLLFLMNNYGFLAVIPFDKIRQPQNRESTRKSQAVTSFCPWKQKRCRMSYVFNGDFVDRGAHSLEVIGLLLALKVSMPNRIWLVRGNHEDRTHGPTPRRNVSNVSSVWWNIWNHRGAGWPTFFTISGLI